MLVREWNGRMQKVAILADGFAWTGRTYRSLSKVAQAITGTRWNGRMLITMEVAFCVETLEEDRGMYGLKAITSTVAPQAGTARHRNSSRLPKDFRKELHSRILLGSSQQAKNGE
jgi:hypothetical protein